MVSVETLERLASETSFRPEGIERVVRLLDFLRRIARDPLLGPRFALKGGTALNLFYLGMDRLSVDVDLNYVGAGGRGEMLADKAEAERRIAAIASRAGYRNTRTPDREHAGGKWVFRYPSAYGRQGTLEIDTNYLYRVPFFGTRTMASVHLGEFSVEGIQVVELDEVVAGKLVAMVTRRASRDLFDMRRLLDCPAVDWDRVKAASVVIGAASRDFDWREASLDRYRYDAIEMRSKLLGVVRLGEVAAGSEVAWCEAALDECRRRLAGLFDLGEGERAFLDAVYDEGRIDVSSLPGDDGFRERVARFPALLWKAQHRRDHLAGEVRGPRVR